MLSEVIPPGKVFEESLYDANLPMRSDSADFVSHLRELTRDAHTRLEDHLGLETIAGSRDAYRTTLKHFWGIYHPLERALRKACTEHLGCAGFTAWRSRRLTRDLMTLGVSDEEFRSLEIAEELPSLACPEHIWGCLYVIEGSSLGGQLIVRRVTETLGLTARTGGVSFFSGYGADTGLYWKQFRSTLNLFAESSRPGARAEIAQGANSTFQAFHTWFDRCAERS